MPPFAIAAQAAWLAYLATGKKSRLMRRGGKWYVLNETAIK